MASLIRSNERLAMSLAGANEIRSEIEAVYKAGMDQTLIELNELKHSHGETDHALDGQIDSLILSNLDKINDIIDSVLQTGVQRVDDARDAVPADAERDGCAVARQRPRRRGGGLPFLAR